MPETELKIKKTLKEKNNELELAVEAPIEVSDKAYSLTLREIAETIDVPGFRKGKAPRDVIEKSVGVGYVSQKAFEKVFYELLITVSNKEKLDIIDVVQISSFELFPGKPLTFTAVVELKPEIKVGKYKNLKVKSKKIVYDKEVFINKTLEKISQNLVTFQKITNRGTKEGDQVLIDFEGRFEDGSDVPGGKAENFVASLEKEQFLPGFINGLVGSKIDEEKEILISFPENYQEGFSGKKAKFKVRIKEIQEKVIPAANDDLAKKVGLENLSALKEKIVLQMIDLQNLVTQNELENKTVEEVIKNSKYELSERMVEKEIDFLLKDVKESCLRNQIEWNTFKRDEKNKELFSKARETAIKRILIDLVLSTIVKNEDIVAKKEEVDQEVKNRIIQLGEKYKQLEGDGRFRNTVEMVILRNKAVDFLLKNNEVVWEKEVTTITPD